jgi:glycosyltransferase involved in cell wall biosynthesis
MKQPLITVFTPTYNRGYIIENLYLSLKRQTNRNFEWLVIDDGSTDNTKDLFDQYIAEENDFKIIYKRIPNGGKHRAINLGVKMAQGELFFIVDSDDYLTNTALEKIIAIESCIEASQKETFCGICGQRGYSENKMIGTSFSGDCLDATALQQAKYGITGDKAEVYYTAVLKKYPFPEFKNEKFLTECVVWDKMAFDGYKLRFFNDIIYICNYLPDGLTANANKAFIDSPKGWGLYLYQCGLFQKIHGLNKWKKYYIYYDTFAGKFSNNEIAKNLHMQIPKFYALIFFMKLYYRFHK